jgi:hypothetical protein
MPFSADKSYINYLYADADDAKSSYTVNVPETAAADDVKTFADAHLVLANAVSALQPYGYNTVFRRTRDGAPAAGSGEKEKKGVFLFIVNAAGRPTMKLSLPGPLDAIMAGDNESIDQTNPNVVTFLHAMLTGTTDGTTPIVAGIGGAVSGRGDGLLSASATAPEAKRAYKYHRASSRTSRRRVG